jgi:hypothetical protein
MAITNGGGYGVAEVLAGLSACASLGRNSAKTLGQCQQD